MKSLHSYRNYPFSIEFDEEDPWYTVDFPDIPGIITSGSTLTEAFAHACEALDVHMATLAKLGLPIPKPKRRLVFQAKRPVRPQTRSKIMPRRRQAQLA